MLYQLGSQLYAEQVETDSWPTIGSSMICRVPYSSRLMFAIDRSGNMRHSASQITEWYLTTRMSRCTVCLRRRRPELHAPRRIGAHHATCLT